MPKHKRKTTKTKNTNFLFALTFAAFSVLGYLGISYITQPNTPIIAETNPYDNAQKNLDYQSTQDKELTIKQQKDFDSTNKNLTDNKKAQDNAAADAIIKKAKDSKSSDEVKAAAARIKIKQAQEKEQAEAEVRAREGVTCPGGNGTVIPAGMWVATGGTYNEDSSLRRCVQCGTNGRYDNADGKDQSCSDAYASDSSHTILPNNAGDPYTNGIPSASSCYRGATLYPNSSLDNNQRCYNGSWLDLDDANMADYNTFMTSYCSHQKLDFDVDSNKCQEDIEPEVVVEEKKKTVPEEKSSEQILTDSRKAWTDACHDQISANNKSGTNRWITCTTDKNGITVMKWSTRHSTEVDCQSHSGNGAKCVPIQGNGGWMVIADDSYNSDVSAGKLPESESSSDYDSSDFTPPGRRASAPNDCAWGYNDDDHDKLTCAERDDGDANQTDEQIARVEGHDMLADEGQQNDLTEALTSGDFYNDDELSMADINDVPASTITFTKPGEPAKNNDKDSCEYGYTWEWSTFQRTCTEQGAQARHTSEQEVRNNGETLSNELTNSPIDVNSQDTTVQDVANGAVIGGGALGLGCAAVIATGILAPVAIPGCIIAGVIIGGTAGAFSPTPSTQTAQAVGKIGDSCSSWAFGNDECISSDCKLENTTGGGRAVCSGTINKSTHEGFLLEAGELTNNPSLCESGEAENTSGEYSIITRNFSGHKTVVVCK